MTAETGCNRLEPGKTFLRSQLTPSRDSVEVAAASGCLAASWLHVKKSRDFKSQLATSRTAGTLVLCLPLGGQVGVDCMVCLPRPRLPLICLQRGCPRIMRSRLRLPAARYPQNRASQQALRLKHSATRIR